MLVRALAEEDGKGIKAARRRAYICVLLTQLRNGTRVSEAAEAVYKFAFTRKREIQVRVRKRRKPVLRLVVIPPQVVKHIDDVRVAVAGLGEKRAVYRLSEGARAYARRHLGFNSHSLRYAFISHLAKRGVAPQLIAKMTMHAKLDYILHYTSTKKAEDLLREVEL